MGSPCPPWPCGRFHMGAAVLQNWHVILCHAHLALCWPASLGRDKPGRLAATLHWHPYKEQLCHDHSAFINEFVLALGAVRHVRCQHRNHLSGFTDIRWRVVSLTTFFFFLFFFSVPAKCQNEPNKTWTTQQFKWHRWTSACGLLQIKVPDQKVVLGKVRFLNIYISINAFKRLR